MGDFVAPDAPDNSKQLEALKKKEAEAEAEKERLQQERNEEASKLRQRRRGSQSLIRSTGTGGMGDKLG